MTDMDRIMAEMKKLKKADEKSEKNNVIKRTLSKLLAIEKKATYGFVKGGRHNLLEKEILAEIKNYKEENNAS